MKKRFTFFALFLVIGCPKQSPESHLSLAENSTLWLRTRTHHEATGKVWIKNTSSKNLAPATLQSDVFKATGGSCLGGLPANEICELDIVFSPQHSLPDPYKAEVKKTVLGLKFGDILTDISITTTQYGERQFLFVPFNLPEFNQFPAGNTNDLSVTPEGIIYAATPSGLAISRDGGMTWMVQTMADGLISNYVISVYAEKNEIYAGTDRGLAISKDGGMSYTLRRFNSDSNEPIQSIYKEGNKLLVAVNSQLFGSKDGGKTFQTIGKFSEKTDRKINFSQEGRQYEVIKRKLHINGKPVLENGYDGNPATFAMDGNQVYLGHVGLQRSSRGVQGPYTAVPAFKGKEIGRIFLSPPDIFVTARASGDSLWISEDKGNTFQELILPNYTQISTVYPWNALFVGTTRNLLVKKHGETEFRVQPDLPEGEVTSMVSGIEMFLGRFSEKQSLWKSKDGGNTFTEEKEFPGNMITALALGEGGLYIGTQKELWVRQNPGKNYIVLSNFGGKSVKKIATVGKGIYVATRENGLWVSRDLGNSWETYFQSRLINDVSIVDNHVYVLVSLNSLSNGGLLAEAPIF